MAVKGYPKFNAIAVSEITADVTNTGEGLACKAAFVSSSTGMTHGWTVSKGPWSKRTVGLLQELRAAMEEDVGDKHLESVEPAIAGDTSTAAKAARNSGLGEMLREADTEAEAQQA